MMILETKGRPPSSMGENQTSISIRQPDLLLISDQALNVTAFGCDQDWYAEHWMRQAGCGPCTAATILYYLARSRSFLDHLYTASSHAKEDFTHFMTDIWHYVTPGTMGVNEASILAEGVTAYAANHNIVLRAEICKVPSRQKRQDDFIGFRDFISNGLENDCPIAFLNLSNGKLENLDSWHWVTITGLQSDGLSDQAIIADSGERKVIDLDRWYQTSFLGGAAVWFTVE
jgi:hypothetical protein